MNMHTVLFMCADSQQWPTLTDRPNYGLIPPAYILATLYMSIKGTVCSNIQLMSFTV